VQAAQDAVKQYGVGPAAVRSIAGTLRLHVELEKRLAAFKGVEAAITFQSGFNANLATLPALVGKEDVIYSDRLNHASIIDGCRLSGAKIVAYDHCSPAHLKETIAAEKKNGYRRALIVTDGVFSMDGDVAPLPEIYAIARDEDILLMVDDAHGEGVLGRGGRGLVDHFGLHGKVDIEVGTLSKAFGVIGGYVAGRQILVAYLKQRARPYLFSSAATAADVAACIAAVELLQQSQEKVAQLWDNTHFFQERLRALGFDLGRTQTPITPIMVGEAQRAKMVSAQLFNAGIFVQAVTFPTVPRDTARLRVMLSAAHTRQDLEFAHETFTRIGQACQLIPAA
jgi:glycine C-acetyltransferase